MMNISRTRLSFLFVLLLGIAPLLNASAQEAPATPVPGSAPIGVLAEFDIEMLPAPHAEVWFLRFGLEPGGRIPEGSNAGPAVIYVESGTLTVNSDGTVIPGDTVAAATDGLTLEAGDSVLVPRDVPTEELNTSDEPATFLMLVMFSATEEGQGSNEQPVGMTQSSVSVGTAEFFPGPATIVLERVVVEPDDVITSPTVRMEGIGPGWIGIDLGMVETGSADLQISQRSFQVLVWPPFAGGEMMGPDQVELTSSLSLESGYGYAAFNSTLTWTPTSDEPLTILRAVITPEMG
jgi:quercetin dioxygenase-like cupin family protein